MREKVSACITCCDEEKNIRRCLESVRWADEIVVVDSFSKDRTLSICREYTERIYQHKWLGYIGQKNLIKDLANGPWILFIDADEEISPVLRAEIEKEFESGTIAEYDGYEFPRMVYYLGRWIRHGEWYPDVKLRLFRKDKGICGGKEPHDRTSVPGAVKRLTGHLYHYTYENVADQMRTLNDFSSITAKGMFEARSPFRWYDLLFRPIVRFLRGFFVKGGMFDGRRGLVIAMCSSFGVFLKYAKLYELEIAAEAAAETQSTPLDKPSASD